MLLNHAMGNTNEAESLIISSHITYCSACKAEVAKYENIGGFYLKNHEELKVSKSLWNNLLDKIDDTEQDREKTNFVGLQIKTRLDKNGVRIPSFFINIFLMHLILKIGVLLLIMLNTITLILVKVL